MTKTEAVTQMMFCLQVSNDVKLSDKLQGQMDWQWVRPPAAGSHCVWGLTFVTVIKRKSWNESKTILSWKRDIVSGEQCVCVCVCVGVSECKTEQNGTCDLRE